MQERLENIILDRDGTVIEEAHYLSSPEGVRLLPGVGRALRRVQQAGFRLYILGNQSGVGRGFFSFSQHERVQNRVKDLLMGHGVRLNGERFCFHAPEAGCSCRKPRPGLWDDLAASEGLVPAKSAMVGDKPDDIRLARICGLGASILVLTGHGRSWAVDEGLPLPKRGWRELTGTQLPGHPHVVASDLASACGWILEKSGFKE